MCAHYYRSVRFPTLYYYLYRYTPAYRTWPDDYGSGCYCFTRVSVHKSLSSVPIYI